MKATNVRNNVIDALNEAVKGIKGARVELADGILKKIIPIATILVAYVRKGPVTIEVAHGPGIRPSEHIVGLTVFRRGEHDIEASEPAFTREEIIDHVRKVLA